MTTASPAPQSASAQPAVRTTTTTIWLWLIVVLNIVMGLITFVGISALVTIGTDTFTILLSVISALVCFVVAVGAYLILRWKKIGFFIIAGCVALNIVLALMGGGNVGTAIFSALLSLGVLYYVLQYPKDNKAWNHLA